MTNTELAELFLTTVFDRAEAGGHNTLVELNKVAETFGIKDDMRVHNLAKSLESRGLIRAEYTNIGPLAQITGDGAIFVERGGDTGIIKRYRENPGSLVVNIDKSTIIHGNITNSNVAVQSSNVSQVVSLPVDVQDLLTKIVETLHKDAALSKERLADALQDVETLKIQLSKTTKNKSTIQSTLATLADISSIGSLVAQLGPLILSLL